MSTEEIKTANVKPVTNDVTKKSGKNNRFLISEIIKLTNEMTTDNLTTKKSKRKLKAKTAAQLKNEAIRKENKELKITVRNLTKENITMKNAMKLFQTTFNSFNTKEFSSAMKIINKLKM